eukprot:3107835-Prymnesium_polylepis.1
MARSTEPCGGWKRYASSPPNSSSSVVAYLSKMGVRAPGSEAANGPSASDEGGLRVSRERGCGCGVGCALTEAR